jgi:hypothetical protein
MKAKMKEGVRERREKYYMEKIRGAGMLKIRSLSFITVDSDVLSVLTCRCCSTLLLTAFCRPYHSISSHLIHLQFTRDGHIYEACVCIPSIHCIIYSDIVH